MTVAVLVPWKPGCEHRERAWAWAYARYIAAGYAVVEGASSHPEFSRTAAILDARARSSADVLVVADSDVWCDQLVELVDLAMIRGWAIPDRLHRLSAPSTVQVLAGHPWRGLPLSTDNRQDRRPYRIHPAGTLLVLTASAFDTAPPDPRFAGWGQEDDAWAAALRTLVGPPVRAGGVDVVHLWHPPQSRRNRVVGNATNAALARRYTAAARHPDQMLALVEEARSWDCASS